MPDEDALETAAEDPLFPSGPWRGYYVYAGSTSRHRMDLGLRFAGGSVHGSGTDDVGAFTIAGSYDTERLDVLWVKTYPGSHRVHYRGFREGRGIWGTWSIDASSHGGFRIWPRGIGGIDQMVEEDLEEEEAAAPLPATVGVPAVPEAPADPNAPRARRARGGRRTGALALVLALAAASACTSTPEATELPHAGEPDLVAVADPPAGGTPAESEGGEGLPQVEHLTLKDVKGGRIQVSLPGSVAEVVAMLLDFEHADGRRAWAERHELLEREDGRVVAAWHFAGKMGIDPSTEILFERTEEGPATVIRYRLTKPAFGLAAFFGDYRVEPDPSDPGRSLLTERVFIDSGLWIANASAEDIADGLREDARRMEAWMTERLR